ncbi:MAG: hypothetical protein Q9Q40_13845, partial [Acidobacteriota bacterium]|nr:hypothetical protein [Acidobacteriota bacterium]
MGDLTAVRGVPVIDPTAPIVVIYGRRRVSPKALESGHATWGTTDQKVVFFLLSEGPIDSVPRWYLDGEETADEVGTIKTLGIFYRVGAVGVDDDETEAEYNADASTQQRAQNRDYRSVTGQTYSETAYAAFVSK